MSAPLPKGWTQDEVDKCMADLNAQGEQEKLASMRSHVPNELQPHLEEYLAVQVVVRNGDSVIVQTNAGGAVVGSPGSAVVSAAHLDRVRLGP